METRAQAKQRGSAGSEEIPLGYVPYSRERPGNLAVRGPREDHSGAEGGGGGVGGGGGCGGRERLNDGRRGKGKGKGKGREESSSTPTPTPTPPQVAPRAGHIGSTEEWEYISDEELQIAKDGAPGQNNEVALMRNKEGSKTPSSPQASNGTLSTDGGVSHQDVLYPMRAGMEGAALQAGTREDSELREENEQLKEKVSELKQKLKDSEKNVVKMGFQCERLQKQIAGDQTVVQDSLDGGESLTDQIDELRSDLWERDEKIKELKEDLAYNVERSRTLTMIRDHSTNQSRTVMTLKDRIKALEEHILGGQDALPSDSDQESLTALVTTLEAANEDMGRKLEAVEKDKTMLEEAYIRLKQDKNKRISDMHHEIVGLSSDKGQLKKQNAALEEYLEKAHQQLGQQKQKEEEGRKYIEELQTKLDVMTAQVAVFEEDFKAERNSRAEAVGKADDVREVYEKQIEEMKKDLSTTRSTLHNTEQLLLMKQEQFRELLDAMDKEHKDYQEKMESDLAAKAAQVKQYFKQTMAFKEQVERLAKEKEEAVKDRDQTKQFFEEFRKKYEMDSLSAASESKSTGRKANKKKKSNTTSLVEQSEYVRSLEKECERLLNTVEKLTREKASSAPVQQVHQASSGVSRQSAPLLENTEEDMTAGRMSQQQLMHTQEHQKRLQQQQHRNELGPLPQLVRQTQHRGRQNEDRRPGSAEWDDSYKQDESNLDHWQPTSLQMPPQSYSQQQQKRPQHGGMGQPHPNTDPCLLDTDRDGVSAYNDRRRADARAHHSSGSATHPPPRPPKPPGGVAGRDKGSGVSVSGASVSPTQSPKHRTGAGPRPQKSMEEMLPDPIALHPPAAPPLNYAGP